MKGKYKDKFGSAKSLHKKAMPEKAKRKHQPMTGEVLRSAYRSRQ